MMITVRIDDALEKKILALSKIKMCSKSDIVKESLTRYLEAESSSAYELGKDLFGRDGSGRKISSSQRKSVLKEKIRAKNLG